MAKLNVVNLVGRDGKVVNPARINLDDIEIELVDHKQRRFDTEFFVDNAPATGPGWYIFGRSAEGVIKLVGRPKVPARRNPRYNIAVRRGWLQKRAAQAFCDAVEDRYKAKPLPIPEQVHDRIYGHVGYDGGGCGDVLEMKLVGHKLISDQYLADLFVMRTNYAGMVAALEMAHDVLTIQHNIIASLNEPDCNEQHREAMIQKLKDDYPATEQVVWHTLQKVKVP